MFWIGFFSIYVILGLLALLMIASRKLFDKLVTTLEIIKYVWCAIAFTLFSFVLTLLYAMIAIATGNIVINALLCAVLLVFSWFVVEKLYQLMVGKKEEKKVLLKEDKNVCNLFSLVGIILLNLVLCFEDRTLEYLTIISIAISIWIGTYIPVSEIYNGKSIKELVRIIAKEFNCKKVSVWISATLVAITIPILLFKNELALKLNTLIDKFESGLAAGSIVMILSLTIYDFIKKKNQKNPCD